MSVCVEGKEEGTGRCSAPVTLFSLLVRGIKSLVTCWVREACVAAGLLVMADNWSSTAALEPISRCSDALAASVLPRRTSQ